MLKFDLDSGVVLKQPFISDPNGGLGSRTNVEFFFIIDFCFEGEVVAARRFVELLGFKDVIDNVLCKVSLMFFRLFSLDDPDSCCKFE